MRKEALAAKQITAPTLNTLVGGPSKVYEASGAQITGAIRALVERAIQSGDIRRDLDPLDLLRALIGVSNVACGPDWQQSARRLVDIPDQRFAANEVEPDELFPVTFRRHSVERSILESSWRHLD
jgi:hypothetical protein